MLTAQTLYMLQYFMSAAQHSTAQHGTAQQLKRQATFQSKHAAAVVAAFLQDGHC